MRQYSTSTGEKECSLGKRILAQLASNTRLLVSTKRYAGIEGVDAVHPHSASVEPVCRLNGSVDVLREHGRSKTVYCVVGLADNVCEPSSYKKLVSYRNNLVLTVHVLKLDDNADGSENLLSDNLHVGLGVGENRGLDEVSFRAFALASQVNGCALGFTGAY